MSIRLRLTLLYSGILAITLVAFSASLYITQSQITYNDLKTSLVRQAAPLVNGPRRSSDHPDQPPPGNSPFPGRWTQLRNSDGSVIARTSDLSDTTLPLSGAGLQSVQNGTEWFETAQVEEQTLLIYSAPGMTQSRFTQIVQVATPMTEREQSLNTLRLILTIGSAIVILAAFAVGWLLSGAALAPIDRITHTAQAIGTERNFSRRVHHAGPNDEIGQLATTFNVMLTRLELAHRQVEQALQSQRRFVADASHELRTPLTTIRGNIELMRREPPIDDRERAEILSDVKHEVDRLIRLVHELLVLARADSARPLQIEPFALQPLLEDVFRQVKLLAPQRTIQYQNELDVTVLADRDALKQVLLILLDNALGHTPASATIMISTALADHRVAMSIHDTGPGIAPDLLPHIFERFVRGDASRSGGGAGLGLSIAKDLIQAQDGTLTVDSQVRRGSVFTVTLPQTAEGIVIRRVPE